MASKRVKTLSFADAERVQAKRAAIAEALGRDVRVFTALEAPPRKDALRDTFDEEELDDFYDLTPDDYYKLLAGRNGEATEQYHFLKTKSIQEEQVAALMATTITETVIRVCFPDGYSLEAKFQSSEKIQSLVDLLMKVVAQPNVPFYLYTTPPKKRIEDLSKEFHLAGFVPGAIIRFSYELPKGFNCSGIIKGPYLRDDIIPTLNKLDSIVEQIDFEINNVVLKIKTAPTTRRPAVKSTKPKM